MGMAVSKRNQDSSVLSSKLIADLQMAVQFHQDNDLKNWAEFEEENPATFAAMYQFRAIKK